MADRDGYFVSNGQVSLAHDWWPKLWNSGMTLIPQTEPDDTPQVVAAA